MFQTVRPKLPRYKGMLTSFFFILPSLLVYLIFCGYPLAMTFYRSLTDWNGMSDKSTFVGIKNYQIVMSDMAFWQSLGRTVVFCVLHVVLAMGLGLILASLIAQLKRGRIFFRALNFAPYVLSLSVVGVLWSQIYNPQFGIINRFLESIGLSSLTNAWLGDKWLALPAISIASSWQAYGFYMVIFLSAIQLIDPQYYESAKLDGAGKWMQFRHITLPMLYNTLSFVLTVAFISGLKGFGTVWSMTKGGPARHSEIIMVYLWRTAFEGSGGMGIALAGSTIFGVIVIVLTTVFNQKRDRGR